jgi:multidrug efflux pump subunit AcrB
LDYPGLQLNIDREYAGLAGVSPRDVVDNVITALTSNGVIAPSFWVDPKSGNNYMLTVQYPLTQIKTLTDFKQIPLRAPDGTTTTPLESVANIKEINTPTEVDHHQLRPRIRHLRHAKEGRPEPDQWRSLVDPPRHRQAGRRDD